MRQLLLILFVISLFSRCASIKPLAYEDSNASLIQESIKNLNSSEILKPHLNKKDNIIIVGLEDFATRDWDLWSILEDNLIKEFVNKGYNILERDYDMAYRLLSEDNNSYTHINRYKKGYYHRGYGDSYSFSKLNSDYLNSKSSSNSIYSESSSGYQHFNEQIESSLESADLILSYRVIECGIRYKEGVDTITTSEILRNARTILEVRLTNAKTSQILAAFTLDGQANDVIEKTDVNELKHFSYGFYRHTLPKQYGTSEEFSEEKKRSGVIAYIVGGLLTLGLLLSL